MSSVPTVFCPKRADSFCAVTSAVMDCSDMRSNIMESCDEEDDVVLMFFECFIWQFWRLCAIFLE